MAIAEASMNRSNSFGNLPLVNITSDMKIKYHGIPSDQDLEKRNEAKELLVNNKALLYVGLLLPNGDRYFGEPYSPYQTDSSTTNFACRDHFIGAVKTKQPYLGNVINAGTTGEPLAILANPIYSDSRNPDSLIAIQVLGLNLSYFSDLIKSTISTEDSNKRSVIADHNGMEIADTSIDNNNTESFKKLQTFQNAKNGESGLLIEEVNGKNMSKSESAKTMEKWLELCNNLKKLDFIPNSKIYSIIKSNKGFKPISYIKLKDENTELCLILQKRI